MPEALNVEKNLILCVSSYTIGLKCHVSSLVFGLEELSPNPDEQEALL